jgi:CheY-like chemotaxis protein
MQVLNGIQTLEYLIKTPKFLKIPIVIFSTDSDVDKTRCISKGAADHMVKPSDMKDLVRIVENMLRYCN